MTETTTPLSPEEISLRQAARTIGLGLYTMDRFVSAAVAWLVERGPISIEQIPAGDGGGWIVKGDGWCSPDERPDWALAGAIHAVATKEEEEEVLT